MRTKVFLIALLLAPGAGAKTFQRCLDAQGHLTYTYTQCPGGAEGIDHRAHNPPPGSVAPRQAKPPARAAAPLVVVGERPKAEKTQPAPQPRKKPKRPVRYRPNTP
ncbi:hypothetical protein [Pseudomonas sp. NPDC007930]|uniref:hypothetical protein n=1 Tax=Pseudomonas sp. NPDC007930 TaxID=3364417 RepID=UPI0036F0D867